MSITVESQGGARLALRIRDHQVVVDQPEDHGGGDAGPTPTELFVASLAGCVAYYAVAFLQRRGVDTSGVQVTCGHTMSDDKPLRVASIDVEVRLPADVSAEWLAPMLRAVDHCVVHNSLAQPPQVRIAVSQPAHVAPPVAVPVQAA